MTQRHSVLPKTSKIIAITSCAGKFKDIFTILSSLPANFPAAIVMIQQPTAFLPEYAVNILDSEIALRVKQAENGEQLSSGVVYVKLPNQSFTITPNQILCLQNTANVDPAADVFLTSLASNCKADAIAVALTENEDLLALQTIRQCGGKTIAPTQAKLRRSHHSQGTVDAQVCDFMLPLEQIASLLMHLVMPEQFSISPQVETRENHLRLEPTLYPPS
ncbi:chemotaxis protein CheB [Nostoc sp. FACHB-152]|uniref:chemotaxis protein CheB n=1 Tax=unclassified Nostoc TaxID=2593658 RepID=UPI00168847CB|nr:MULTISPECIES: chemotaxis protein CheB [unclassified Nostoc]MBD2449637.1 chemotaxis protein CheB [Nostoc sp. FACHB-152]MBD2469699.1 chemotaxis protein CheB [Nostoc sp. FACHB-145]